MDGARSRTSEAWRQVGLWPDALARQTRARPGRSVALALGVGFLLGGGLATRLTARVVGLAVRFGLRMVLVPYVAEGLVALAQRPTESQET